MYSKYSNFSIPKNYSGSRFSTPSEPPMKTHRGEVGSATRHAHSPSFSPHVDDNPSPLDSEFDSEAYDGEQVCDEQEVPFEYDDSSGEECEICDEYEDFQEVENESDSSPQVTECGTRVHMPSLLEEIFSGFDKDQLLITGLILLLISDDANNKDIIFLLAILLFN